MGLFNQTAANKAANKKEAIDRIASVENFSLDRSIKHPYVGIIQIRFSVEGHTLLSARIRAPVCAVVKVLYTAYSILSIDMKTLPKEILSDYGIRNGAGVA